MYSLGLVGSRDGFLPLNLERNTRNPKPGFSVHPSGLEGICFLKGSGCQADRLPVVLFGAWAGYRVLGVRVSGLRL